MQAPVCVRAHTLTLTLLGGLLAYGQVVRVKILALPLTSYTNLGNLLNPS